MTIDTAKTTPPGAPLAATASSPAAGTGRSDLDNRMRRMLRLPTDAPRASKQDAQKAFQTSILVASVRCLLMYVFLPFVLPLIGVAAGVGPWIGLPISVAAIVAVTMSIRRFWRADHPKRWHYTALGTVVIAFMIYSIIADVSTIASR